MSRKKNRMVGCFFIGLILIVLCMCSSCTDDAPDETIPTEPETVLILEDTSPVYNLILSDELFDYMKENSIEMLDLMNDYFNVIINEKIDENVVYIRNDLHEMNAEFNLVDVYDPSNKFSAIVKIAEYAKLAAGIPDKESSSKAEAGQTSSEKEEIKTARETALADMAAAAKKIADKAASYTKSAVENDLLQKTIEIYGTSAEIMADDRVSPLKYKDYYVKFSNSGISIVCGSLESASEALDYFVYEYIQTGHVEGDYFIIPAPKTELHAGEYLSGSIAGKSLKEYVIEYVENKEYYDSAEIADYLNKYFIKNFGLDLLSDSSSSAIYGKSRIVIGKSSYQESDDFYNAVPTPDLMDYQITQSGDNLYILGGSDWAIKFATDYLIENYFSEEKEVPKNFQKSGNISGENLFPKYEGTNLRIMSNNVWERSSNSIYWNQVGENCSYNARLPQMAKVYAMYQPDILSLQEMSFYFINGLVSSINELCANNQSHAKYRVADRHVEGLAVRNYTPIIYNQNTLTLLDTGSHLFQYGQNRNTKSYTWACFEIKQTKQKFVVYSTHFWWKSDKIYPNSSSYRKRQMAEISEDWKNLKKTYNCPCFVMGDMNCNSQSKEFNSLLGLGFVDCYSEASEFARNSSGRFICNAQRFSYKVNNGTYTKNALDHIVASNLKKNQILVYDYVTPNFFGKLSDHAPVYIDVKMKN